MVTGTYGTARTIYPSANTVLNKVTSVPDRDGMFLMFSTYSSDIYDTAAHADDAQWQGFDPFIKNCLALLDSASRVLDIGDGDFNDLQHYMAPYMTKTDVTATSVTEAYNITNPSLWDDLGLGELSSLVKWTVAGIAIVGGLYIFAKVKS